MNKHIILLTKLLEWHRSKSKQAKKVKNNSQLSWWLWDYNNPKNKERIIYLNISISKI